MGVLHSNAAKKDLPGYDYRLDPLCRQNRHVAKLLGWTFDKDFHDYVDASGYRLSGGYHVPINKTAYTPR